MKTSAEYLAAHVFEARRPRRDLQPVVALPDAVAAIEQALADAEKYRYLLIRALRRAAADEAPRPLLPVVNFDTADFAIEAVPTNVLPLYSLYPAAAEQRMAA